MSILIFLIQKAVINYKFIPFSAIYN